MKQTLAQDKKNVQYQSLSKRIQPFFTEDDVVSKYGDDQAVADGLLVDLTPIGGKYFKNSPFNYATTNLLTSGGYLDLETNKANIPNIIDLIMSATQIFKKNIQIVNGQPSDYFASGFIELPSGEQQKIFIAQNMSGKFTIMLPEDR